MTQEEKSLLLKDLCARLGYGVKGKVYAEVSEGKYDINGDMIFYDEPFCVILDEINVSTEEIHVVAIGNEDTVEFIETQQTDGFPYTIYDFTPHLRPMSSMTEEEKEEYCNLQDKFLCSSQYPVTDAYELFDWLNAHHFDYRGLIPMALALEAKEGMYKTKEE